MNTRRFMVTFACIAALTSLAELRLLSAGARTLSIGVNSAIGGRDDCNRSEQHQHICEALAVEDTEEGHAIAAECAKSKYFTFETEPTNVLDLYVDGTTQNKCLHTDCQSVVQDLGTGNCNEQQPDMGM